MVTIWSQFDHIKGWAEIIRKVNKGDWMPCPQCRGYMKVIAFFTDYGVVDNIIGHLRLSFSAEKPPPSQFSYQEVLKAAETPAEYFS